MRELEIVVDSRAADGEHFGATITVVFATEHNPMIQEAASSVHVMRLGDAASDLMFATGASERAALLEIAARWEATARAILRAAESLPMTEVADAGA